MRAHPERALIDRDTRHHVSESASDVEQFLDLYIFSFAPSENTDVTCQSYAVYF